MKSALLTSRSILQMKAPNVRLRVNGRHQRTVIFSVQEIYNGKKKMNEFCLDKQTFYKWRELEKNDENFILFWTPDMFLFVIDFRYFWGSLHLQNWQIPSFEEANI